MTLPFDGRRLTMLELDRYFAVEDYFHFRHWLRGEEDLRLVRRTRPVLSAVNVEGPLGRFVERVVTGQEGLYDWHDDAADLPD